MFKFEQLEIWKDGIAFTKHIYLLTSKFPREELFGLRDQLRRSSSSVPANIAEGSGSSSKKDFAHYLDIAIKSIYETVSHIYVAEEQKYITKDERLIIYAEAEVLIKKIKSFRVWLLKTI